MGRRLVAAVGGTRTAPGASPPLPALAALPVNADQDAAGILQAGGVVEGVAVRTLGSLRAGEITKGFALRAPGPLPSHAAVEATEMVAASVARPGTAVCMDGCAGGTCVDGRGRTFVPAAITVATALAVANPYLNSTRGTAADTGRVDGGAVGGEDACAYTPTATAGTAAEGDAPPAGGDVQGAHGHFMPRTFTEEELHKADPQLQRLTAADRRLLGIFGNTIHLNDGTHLDGGIGAAEDATWQRLYNHVAACSLPLYTLLNGRWAHCFLTTLADLWIGVIQRRWNSERPLVFQAVILRPVRGITQFHDVKPIIWGWLDAWNAVRYVTLVKEVEEANLDSGGGGRRVEV
jgi:hypothetical protein